MKSYVMLFSHDQLLVVVYINRIMLHLKAFGKSHLKDCCAEKFTITHLFWRIY